MIANYHTHTVRCGHAEGTEREYVEAALASGLRILGFSDHTPYDFFDSTPRNRPMRMKPEELPDYAQSIAALAEEYRDRIQILTGVEAEYYPRYFPRLLELLRENGIGYMILAQHFLCNEIDAPVRGLTTEREDILDLYVSQSVEALETGLFTYFAHPDLLNYIGDEAVYTRHYRRLCRAAKATDTPLEINLLGLREGRHYPAERFWQIAAEEENKVVLGCDAHRPSHLLDLRCADEALRMAERLGLRVLETVPIRGIG